MVNQFADMLGYHVEPIMLYQVSFAVNPVHGWHILATA